MFRKPLYSAGKALRALIEAGSDESLSATNCFGISLPERFSGLGKIVNPNVSKGRWTVSYTLCMISAANTITKA